MSAKVTRLEVQNHRKLYVIMAIGFFVVGYWGCWIPSSPFHELGHAIFAKMQGYEVHWISWNRMSTDTPYSNKAFAFGGERVCRIAHVVAILILLKRGHRLWAWFVVGGLCGSAFIPQLDAKYWADAIRMPVSYANTLWMREGLAVFIPAFIGCLARDLCALGTLKGYYDTRMKGKTDIFRSQGIDLNKKGLGEVLGIW